MEHIKASLTNILDGNTPSTHCYIETKDKTFLCTVKICKGVETPSKVLVNGKWIGIRKFDQTYPNYFCGGFHTRK